MTDRHGPFIALAWATGITALAAALLWTTATMPERPNTPRVAPISSISPTGPVGR